MELIGCHNDGILDLLAREVKERSKYCGPSGLNGLLHEVTGKHDACAAPKAYLEVEAVFKAVRDVEKRLETQGSLSVFDRHMSHEEIRTNF